MSNDPSAFRLPSPLEDALHARKMAAPMVSTCAFCGAQFAGAAQDVIADAQAHQRAEHPAAVDRTQKVRREAARLGVAT